ncbi:hypothetical protein K435DRAFT_857242 [Dendrothele bispora CBS 962.96]|uniref:Uncharacterized protein n=1 Tax=Dendrothele bispora (strain CBS 962.96) TaxID=1314807 RepID=A0A4S8M6J5_DENBC|nr:hypothetical protein K435DRAFT_857242 [Dendrothele bispora CBS 962.96]
MDMEIGSQSFNIRCVINQVDNIYSVVQSTRALVQEMQEISDPAKNYVRPYSGHIS